MVADNYQYGGQAVIEGVMMRGRHHYAVAVRKQNDQMSIYSEELGSYTQKHPVLRLPFFRGVIALGESFVLGLKTLQYSANQLMDSEGEEELSFWEMTLMIIFALGLTLLLFIALPLFVRGLVGRILHGTLWRNLFEGLIRAIILVLYITVISLLPDIQRVFAYHGAEHKVIHTYEAGDELTIENAKTKTTLHPRCGTSFLLFVVIVSAILFSFLGEQTIVMRFLSRILLLPVVAGISYEIIKISGKNQSFFLWKALSWPGLMLQRLTTREPDDSQLEVAIMALKQVLTLEEKNNILPIQKQKAERCE
ncbi:MAG TPA: DUF1385 domain-containing protein [Firmicutes bacterium]|nr:DUF1385 domain-containing protein [Bacillota bacterium]HBT15643.1 DUF1385 domain-containing protein [Bacillota bacterium]